LLSDLKLGLLTSEARGAFCCAGFLFSSSIAYTVGMSKSSPLRTLGGGQVTGFSADMFMAKDSNNFEDERSFVRAVGAR
jgi:hypothetical protein